MRLTGLFFCAISLPASGQAASQDVGTAVDVSLLPNDQLLQRLKEAYGAKDSSACRDMVPMLAEMVRRKSFDPAYGPFKLRFDLQCAVDERRYGDAYPLLLQNEKVNGEIVSPVAAMMISLEARQYEAAADRLIAAAGKPANAGGLADSFNNMRWLDGKLTAADRHDVALSLNRRFIKTPAYRLMAERETDYIRETLFRREVEAGNIEAARPLLSNITEPYWFFRLLADRRYVAFWPDLESRAGPNMSTAFAANIEGARSRYRAVPADAEKLSDLATALNEAGLYAEVLTLTEDIATPGKLATLGEFHFWALDARVNALDGLGREAEASELFDAMAAIPLDKTKNGWLVNFVANRSGRLARMGEWNATLDASERAAFVADQFGSPYVRQIIATDRACALAELGRKTELQPLLDKIDQNRADDPAAAVQAMQCAGREDRAAEIAIEALRDPDLRTGMLRNLQGQEFTTFAARTGAPDLFLPLKRRADVAAVFNQFGRDLPQSLVTPAGKRWLDQQKAAAKPAG